MVAARFRDRAEPHAFVRPDLAALGADSAGTVIVGAVAERPGVNRVTARRAGPVPDSAPRGQ